MKEEINTVQANHGGAAIAQHEFLLSRAKRAKEMLRRRRKRKSDTNGRRNT